MSKEFNEWLDSLPYSPTPEEAWEAGRAALAAQQVPSDCDPSLARKLLDVACRMRAGETLWRDDELVDAAAHELTRLTKMAAAPQAPTDATWGAAKALIQRNESIEDALRVFGDDPTDDNGTGVVIAVVIAVLEAALAAAPQAPQLMVEEPAACGLMPLIEDYAKAVHDGDDSLCAVLKQTIKASLAAAPQVPAVPDGYALVKVKDDEHRKRLIAESMDLPAASQPAPQAPLDVCTDPYNCKRCDAPQWDKHKFEHAGIAAGVKEPGHG